ncbi:MAG: hypothetical protein ACRD3I_10780, partial [Terriglobales bacterium]
NKADELVSHWIEAGDKAASFRTRALVEAEAARIGFRPEDLRSIAADVQQVYGKSGRWLESVGMLKPGTVNALGSRYVAQLYHVASHNPRDIDAALKVAQALGALDPRALKLGQEVLNRAAGGGYSALKSRTVETAAGREALLREKQAGVVLAGALPKQARVGARGFALKQISENPELFRPATTLEEVAPRFTADQASKAGVEGTGLRSQLESLQTRRKELERLRGELPGRKQIQSAGEQGRSRIRVLEGRLTGMRQHQKVKPTPSLPKLIAASEREIAGIRYRLEKDANRVLAHGVYEKQIKGSLKLEKQLGSQIGKSTAEAGKVGRGLAPTEKAISNEGPPGWVKVDVGPLKGWLHPVAHDVVKQMLEFKEMTPAQKLLVKYARTIKSFWAGYNPVVQE